MPTDAHATGEGYLHSPRDGSLRDIVATTLAMERAAEVTVERRLGVSLAAHLLGKELGDGAAWGGEWIETEPAGPQGWWPAAECDATLMDALASLGMNWLCVGATAGEHTMRLIESARQAGLQAALRPSADALDAIEAHGTDGLTVESLPLLLDAVLARRAGGESSRSASEAVRALAAVPESELDAATDWIAESGVVVVALVTAALRQTSLRAVVRAPLLGEAARVLPYHDRIASLRAPGAMRMGGKEAALHLGVPILDKFGEREAAEGMRRCRDALGRLLASGHDVRIGSGAPGVGLAPGAALAEERAVFAEMSPVAAGAASG